MKTGDRIRKARTDAGFTQKQLGDMLGLPYQSIGQWERCIRNPKIDVLMRIACACKCDLRWLLIGIEKKESGMTQCDRILEYMETVGPITQLDAAREFGCYRLGARIWDLRNAGHAISKRMVTNKNRYGERVSFAEYRLEDKKC